MNYTTLTLRNAIKKGLLDALTTDVHTLAKEDGKMIVRIYEGDTVLDESIDLTDLFQEANTAGIIVNGNLKVNGTVIDFELDTVSCFLIVNGSLTCTTLAAGCAEIIVNGSVTVAEAMVGFYNHGNIVIEGDLNGRILVIDEHNATIRGKINAATYCSGWQIEAADYTQWRHILLPAVADALLDEDDYLSAGDVRFLQLLKDRQPVFKEDLTLSASNNPEAQVVTWKKIKPLVKGMECRSEKYPFAVMEKESPGLPDVKFLFYNGTTILDELDLNREDYLAIVVVGDLHVNGNIINDDSDSGCSLIVIGNLRAKNVCVGGQLIYVTGYVAVKELLLGVYNHGEFYGRSYVWCPVIISDDFRFDFIEYAQAKVLDLWDDNDKDLIKEKLVDGLLDEDEGFLYFSTIREGGPLLKPQIQRTEVTADDIIALVNSTLLRPKSIGTHFETDGWDIVLHRGGQVEGDPDADPASITASNIDEGAYYIWYVTGANTVETSIKKGDTWIALPPANKAKSIAAFTEIDTIAKRKIVWNDRYVRPIDQDKLWDLIWLFRNSDKHDDETYEVIANKIYQRVIVAAASPFVYIYDWYHAASDSRGLIENPGWATAAALVDGLIEYNLAQEITRRVPLAERTEKLFAVTQYQFDYDCDVDKRYESRPIDRAFIQETNQFLATVECALLRLDTGVPSYIITGSHVDDIALITELSQPLGVFPKYFIHATEAEETALRKISENLLTAAESNDTDALYVNRQHQDKLWAYVYNERGDVAFWQEWIEKFQRRLIDQAGVAYIDRGESDADPLPPELDHWITWCEKYEAISKLCDIDVSDEGEQTYDQ